MTLSEKLRSFTTLADVDPRSTPGFDGGKADGKKAMQDLADELAELQERLYAAGTQGDKRSVLLLLQGMDTAGKGGTISNVAGIVDPQGLRITSFKKPTPEEAAHDFLWRIENALPPAGRIGIFDRSQYEDVLIVRVHQLQPVDEIDRRYGAINDFEKAYVDSGGTIVKCMLHIDEDVQKERFAARLDDAAKYWKYNPDDLKERALWDKYAEAYQVALDRCSTSVAPWHVIPSGRKWYRNWAVATVLLEALRGMDLEWPKPAYDVEAEKTHVAEC